jgi:hypothetical protein
VSPTVKAILQVRSKATGGQWIDVPHANDSALSIRIDNHAPRQNGLLVATTKHFALMKAILKVQPSEFPVVCPAPYDVTTDEFIAPCVIPDNQPDENKKMYQPNTKLCESSGSGRAMFVAKEQVLSLELLPGCANSTWP